MSKSLYIECYGGPLDGLAIPNVGQVWKASLVREGALAVYQLTMRQGVLRYEFVKVQQLRERKAS